MIRLSQLNKSYKMGKGSLHVLKDVELEIHEGELVSIMGSSGSGKSTLLNILGILDDYDSGAYQLAGNLIRDLSERKAAEYRNRFIGFVFQSFNLISFKTAVENVALPLYYQGVSRRKRHKRAMEYLERVGLTDWAGHLPSEMSGGQKQRVAIARALIGQPSLLLADEPTGALDSSTSHELMDLFAEINGEGMTIVVVTHENDIAARTGRVIRLRDGRIADAHGRVERAGLAPSRPAAPDAEAEPVAKRDDSGDDAEPAEPAERDDSDDSGDGAPPARTRATAT